jgi:hypothetical protein
MKKSIALVALAFGVSNAFAQDLTSKKGEPFLPEAGDWAVSIDATPFLNYAGNFFGKTTANSAPTWNFLNGNNTIVGKYFKDANTAYRVGIRLGFGGNTEKKNVADVLAAQSGTLANQYPTNPATVENKHKHSTSNIGISVGIEKRKGKTRLQGIYGADAGIYFGSAKDKYTYGNALVATTSASTTVNVNPADGFGGDIDGAVLGTQYANVYDAASSVYNFPTFSGGAPSNPASARMTQMKSGTTISFGVRAFIGAEYFILPKISLGGEFGWGLGLSMTGKSTTNWESIATTAGATADAVGTTEVIGGKSSSFGLDTDGKNGVFGPSAALRLALHF